MKPNLELDLFNNDTILQKCKYSKIYSQNLYAALCNNKFFYNHEEWTTSWRGAGGIIADIRNGINGDWSNKEDYLDWYCSGMGNAQGVVPEGFVTDEIRLDLLKLGWTIKSYEPKLEPGVYRNAW